MSVQIISNIHHVVVLPQIEHLYYHDEVLFMLEGSLKYTQHLIEPLEWIELDCWVEWSGVELNWTERNGTERRAENMLTMTAIATPDELLIEFCLQIAVCCFANKTDFYFFQIKIVVNTNMQIGPVLGCKHYCLAMNKSCSFVRNRIFLFFSFHIFYICFLCVAWELITCCPPIIDQWPIVHFMILFPRPFIQSSQLSLLFAEKCKWWPFH